jgi:hypothetical protein
MIPVLAWLAFVLGAWICLGNFYLSFVSHPLHRLRGLSKESFHGASGAPFLGSILVGISLLHLHSINWMLPIGIGLILIDTGGIHWCAGVLIYLAFREQENDSCDGSESD